MMRCRERLRVHAPMHACMCPCGHACGLTRAASSLKRRYMRPTKSARKMYWMSSDDSMMGFRSQLRQLRATSTPAWYHRGTAAEAEASSPSPCSGPAALPVVAAAAVAGPHASGEATSMARCPPPAADIQPHAAASGYRQGPPLPSLAIQGRTRPPACSCSGMARASQHTPPPSPVPALSPLKPSAPSSSAAAVCRCSASSAGARF